MASTAEDKILVTLTGIPLEKNKYLCLPSTTVAQLMAHVRCHLTTPLSCYEGIWMSIGTSVLIGTDKMSTLLNKHGGESLTILVSKESAFGGFSQ